MKYCCLEFEVYAKLPSTSAPNIRIVKYLPMVQYTGPINLGFYSTFGYSKFDISLPKLNLKFCPFCGVALTRFHNSDKYANEIEGESF